MVDEIFGILLSQLFGFLPSGIGLDIRSRQMAVQRSRVGRSVELVERGVMSGRYAVADAGLDDAPTIDITDVPVAADDHNSRTPFGSLTRASVGSDAESRIADGFMACVGRWGVGKTTVEDIAREAGLSRATVYRHFPGGKSAIAATAWSLDVSKFIAAVTDQILDARSIEDALVVGMTTVVHHFGRHPALNFMRDHEPAEFERLVSFERMDTILLASGTSMAPLLGRFLDPVDSFDVSVWMARILVSYIAEPAAYFDLGSEKDVRRFVRTFILPGLAAEKTSQTKTSTQGDLKNLGDQNVHC